LPTSLLDMTFLNIFATMVAGLVNPLVNEVKFSTLLKKLNYFITINIEIE